MTDFAQNLGFLFSVVPHKVIYRGITSRTVAGGRDIAGNPPEYRSEFFVVALLVVGNEIFPVPFLLKRNDSGELVDLIFLIFGRVGIIKSPLFERDISADKVQKLTDNFMLVFDILK